MWEYTKNLSAELRTGAVDEVVLSVGEDSDLYCIRLPRLEFTHQDSNHRMDKYALQLLRSISSSPDFQHILSQDCPPLNTCIFVKKNSANFGVDWLSPYDGFPDTWDPANKVIIQFTCRPPSEPRICCGSNLEASPLKESCSEELSWFKSKKVLQGCNVTA
uniref:Uncharacterized protein n=1 Tax=Timema bartmani TaxID=61472 RepID=A0A7R9ESY9_9NEOP|nr:unnamed protein product [Timema bartmani]